MKIFLIVTFLLIASFSVCAQDLIVTYDGDSINCKITKVKKSFVYFSYKDSYQPKSTLLRKRQISYYKRGFFSHALILPEEIIGYYEFSRMSIGVSGGIGYRLEKASKGLPKPARKYYSRLNLGHVYSVDANYFTTPFFSVGAKANFFESNNSIPFISIIFADGSYYAGKMEDKISMSFIGPTIGAKWTAPNSKNAFCVRFSIGYFEYFNINKTYYTTTYSAHTSALINELEYNFNITRHLSAGVNGSYFFTTINSMKMKNSSIQYTRKYEKPESLTRFDLSLSLRLNFL